MGDTFHLLLKGAGLYALYRATWFFLRPYLAKTGIDNVPGPPSKWYHLAGLLPQVYDIGARKFHQDLVEKYGSVIRVRGLLGADQLYVTDPKALYHIIVKDQYIYEETPAFLEINRLIFGEGILASLGAQHRKHRKMLNPIFSSSHMREMIPIFYDVTHKVVDTFSQMCENDPREVDLLCWMTRLALELIGQSGLGYSFDSLTAHATPHPFSTLPKEFIPMSFPVLFIREYILPIVVKIGTPKFRRWVVDTLPLKGLHDVRDIVDIMYGTSVEIYETKKRAIEKGDDVVSAQIVRGKDLISILMRANLDASSDDRLTETELIGQLTSLIFAAMDTTSGALTHIIHLLSEHPDVQERLREEILNVTQGGMDLDYDQLNALPYLDAVCRETLRMYPPVSLLQRTAIQDIVLPLSKPVTGINGTAINELHIPKDTTFIIPIIASNIDPQIWGPDSYEWKPERWLEPLPEIVQNAQIPGIYSHLMTFLGGGRGCIGFKFSQLDMKVVLSSLLSSFQFEPSGKNIYWHLSTISCPSLEPNDCSKPQLPLVIRRIGQSKRS